MPPIDAHQPSATHTGSTLGLRRLADLPGPRALPLLGNLHQFDFRRLHQTLEKWTRQHGPVYRVTVPRSAVLVLADPDLVGKVLRERPDTFRRPGVLAAVAAELGGMTGLFDSEGATWRNQRRMVMQAFAPQPVKAYFPSLVEVARRLQRRWEDRAEGGDVIDLGADLRLYSVDIVAGLAFGTDVNTIEMGDHPVQRNLDMILQGVARRTMMPFPYWRYVRLPADRRLERSVIALRDAVFDLVAQAKERMRLDPLRAANPPNMLEAMLAAAAKGGSGVTEADVAGNVSTMLLAGEDTTSNSLVWLIWLLQRHPDALQRAREEVLRCVPSLDELTIEQIRRLDFLDACTHESMRLKPAAPFISVEALEDTTVGDVAIDKGTIVLCLMRDTSPDNTHFENAAQFDPRRWLLDSVNRKAAMPFGAGPRICPGRYLALLEIKVAMVMLLARFDIASLATAHGGEPDERLAFAMSPETLHIRLRLRV
ncbi:cytochrome P450 [Paraburkholderia caledonica]|uniref:cytochrome P450 n=1 Tax=Paraburkholderia caledonica TaxID=134536 RepID=UPI000DF018A4|nr:cytochrome P450 [Paraburkholderia caledonica]AXF18955.1 cytochrome P450 [Paraburkholderia caledonica]